MRWLTHKLAQGPKTTSFRASGSPTMKAGIRCPFVHKAGHLHFSTPALHAQSSKVPPPLPCSSRLCTLPIVHG